MRRHAGALSHSAGQQPDRPNESVVMIASFLNMRVIFGPPRPLTWAASPLVYAIPTVKKTEVLLSESPAIRYGEDVQGGCAIGAGVLQ